MSLCCPLCCTLLYCPFYCTTNFVVSSTCTCSFEKHCSLVSGDDLLWVLISERCRFLEPNSLQLRSTPSSRTLNLASGGRVHLQMSDTASLDPLTHRVCFHAVGGSSTAGGHSPLRLPQLGRVLDTRHQRARAASRQQQDPVVQPSTCQRKPAGEVGQGVLHSQQNYVCTCLVVSVLYRLGCVSRVSDRAGYKGRCA